MRLPDHAFARIRRCLKLSDEAAVEGDRAVPQDEDGALRGPVRREPRWRLNVDVPCVRHGTVEDVLRTVNLRDLSAVGACIISNQQLGAGDRFVLYLPWGAGEHVPVICQVKTVRIKSDGRFRVGAEFVEAGDAVLRQRGKVRASGSLVGTADEGLWGRVTQAPGTGRDVNPRRHPRRAASCSATIYTYGEGDKRGPLETVQARDFSDGGVSILRGEPLEPGQRFVINLPLPGKDAVTRLCRVAHVTLSDNLYHIGAEYVPFPNRPPESNAGLGKRIQSWLKTQG